MTADPVIIVPKLVERVWGRTTVGPWYEDRPGRPPVGEAWLTDIGCDVESGGTLADLLARDPVATLGDAAAHGAAPILVKMLFTAEALSVQVHPTDEAARATGVAPTGKNECWHILDAAPDAVVEVGFTAPVTRPQLRAAVADGTVMGLMARRPVHPGDTVPVKAGTVHAIGAGLVLLEVQDPAQVTYRLFDYGRPRELQLDEGLAVADLGVADAADWTAAPAPVLVSAPRFVLERRAPPDGTVLQPDGRRCHILVPLAPGATLDGRPMRPGVATLVPAAGRAVSLGGGVPVAVVHAGPGVTPCLSPGIPPR